MPEDRIAAEAPAGGWPAMSLDQVEAELCRPGSRFELETAIIRGQEYRCWKHRHRNLTELARAARNAYHSRDMLVYEDERITYDGWFRAVAQLAEHLAEQGVGKGDRVALAMRNYPEWPVAFFAIAATGAICVPLNAWWAGAELRYAIQRSGARMLLCDAERWQRIQPELVHLPELERSYVCRADGNETGITERLESVIGSTAGYGALPERDLPTITIMPDDDATILFTSGTTGAPKGALGTHRSNLAYILFAAYVAAQAACRRGKVPVTPPPPVLLSAVPLFHVTGLNVSLLSTIDTGGTLVMMHHWEAEHALALIEQERVTASIGVPTTALALLEHPERQRYDLGSFVHVIYGGAPSSPQLAARIREELRANAATGWGMTETCAAGTRHGDEDYLYRPDSCGPISPGTELLIADLETGAPLPTNEVGELLVRGAQVVSGYWNDPEATAATIRDGWLRTGDLARLDSEGFCYIVGRSKDLIIRGGENIYPIEIENVLASHPDVADVAVVGLEHRTLGEVPAAAVHLARNACGTEASLKAWVGGQLAAFKTPVLIAFFGTMLPRNANGKIEKATIRAMLESINKDKEMN